MQDKLMIGIIGGSGLGDALLDGLEPEGIEKHHIETPFGDPSSQIITARCEGVDIALLQRHGDGHILNPASVPYRANIFALKSLGVTHIVASGATGSLREHIHPGDLVLVDQIIDKTNGRAKTFYEHAAVHVEFADPCCAVMRAWLQEAAHNLEGQTVHETGTYVCMEGPAFSTRAESELHRQWGADLIGMTAIPEAKLAREAEIAYALVSLPTDYDCWKPHEARDARSLLVEIIGNLQKASKASINLIKAALKDVTKLREQPSSAHEALALAIWSDKSKLDPDEVKRLHVLWGKYFE
ncbi:MAG: S-methyl-5'-thioadenosine phosphorylase [Planctomycetota bacterium]|nr:S-methyl-5'-thioadenosine phosphorylase [Planctomycetota bacterium]